MKQDNKKAKKDRKKVTVKDLRPKADSQVKGGRKATGINHNETLLRGA